MPRTVLVVNPRAGRGRVGKELPRLVATLKAAGAEPQVMTTQRPGHATDLARTASRNGADTVVAVGGDGTVNEVVNGLILDDRPIGHAALGVVAAGSGADFARSFGYPPHTGERLHGILGGTTPLDVGRLTCDTASGQITRYFVNVAEAGMGAATVRAAERLPRRLGKSRYLVAFWPTLAGFRPCEVTVVADDERFTGRTHNVIIANAGYFGGGMRISPHSDPIDGVVDLQINIGPKRQAVTLIPKIFKGRHLPDKRIVQMSGRTGSVDAASPLPVEADGEMIGTTPLTFAVLPGVLRLRTG
ncbi:MAG: diacylglycerol kinase family protein [Actinomycetota bacterium]